MIDAWIGGVDWAAMGAMLSGLATAAVAVLTVLVVCENRKLRKAGNSPRVVAHFELHHDGTGGLNLALSNVGTGPAFDVSFEFEREPGDFENYEIILKHAVQRPAMTMIAQNEKVSFLFAVGFQLFRPKDAKISKQLKPFNITVSWRSSSSEQFSAKYRLDISAFAGLPGMMSKPHLMRIADELAGIKEQLSKLVHRHSLATVRSGPLIDATQPEQGVRTVVKGTPAIVSTSEESD